MKKLPAPLPWPSWVKFCRAPSTMTATRPKSCRPRILMAVWVELPFWIAVTPGMPRNRSCVRVGIIISIVSGRTTLTAARVSIQLSCVRVATTVIGSSSTNSSVATTAALDPAAACCAIAGAAVRRASNETPCPMERMARAGRRQVVRVIIHPQT